MDHTNDGFRWPALRGPWERITPSFRLAFFAACLVGFLTHLYLLTNLLPNHDSIHSTFTNNDVLSSGRWSAQLLSSFSTYFQLPVVIGLISILALAVTAGLTVRILGLSHPVHIVLAAGLLVTFPSISAIFSYLFTADAYFLALMLNALGVFCAKRYRWGWLAAVLLLAVACGTYQAFICYAIGLFLLDCVLMLLEGEALDRTVKKGLGYIAVCGGALILYYAVMKLLLLVTHTQLVDYQGMNQMSLGNILLFLGQIPRAYLVFFKHFLAPGYLNGFYRLVQLLCCVFLVCAGLWLAAARGLFRDPPRLLLTAAGLALVPLALDFVAVLTVGGEVHQLMIYAFVLVFLLAIKVSELLAESLVQAGRPAWRGVFGAGLVLSALLVWCGFYTNNVSYLRLQVRYENSIAVANRIAGRVESLEGYTPQTPVALVGSLPDGLYGTGIPALFDPHPLTGTDSRSLLSYYSARDLLEHYAALRMPGFTDEQWQSVYGSDLIYEMPCWPEAGSVILYNGVAVVKLGEP